jgi:hypothetical protein
MEKFNVDKEKVRTLLARAPISKHRNERHLCRLMGITPPTLWRRFKDSSWKREQVIALIHCLSEISCEPPVSIDEITL